MRAWTLKARSGDTVNVNGGNFIDGFAVSLHVRSSNPDGLAILTPREAERLGDAVRVVGLNVQATKAKRAASRRR